MAKSGLAGSFERANGGERRLRDIASITGEVGAGKTYFGLTAPSPTVVFNIDRGLEGVADKEEFEDKEIYQHVIDWNPGDQSDPQANAIELRDEFIDKYKEAIQHARTIIIDTESRLWQLYRYAEFGAPGGDLRDFDALNQRYESFINLAKGATCNLFLIRSMKDNWTTKGTGKLHKDGRDVWGYEHLTGVVMSELFFRMDETIEADPDDPNARYVIDIAKCRHNLSLQFTTVPRMSFPRLGQLMVPGTKTKDWM